MPGATSALYEPLLERDFDAFREVARSFGSDEELWTAVTRFAVLAYAPSQHGKRAVMACRAAYQVRDELGERWRDTIVECGCYAGEARQPWSEAPILDLPEPFPGSLDDVLASGDRAIGERWLAAHLDDAASQLREAAQGDALLMLETAVALEPLLGEKGRFALLRMPVAELFVETDPVTEPLETLIDRAIDAKGAVDAVRAVFVAAAFREPHARVAHPLEPYRLARDYAQTLIAHAVARTLPARAADFVAAVHHHLEHGESFAEWTFA